MKAIAWMALLAALLVSGCASNEEGSSDLKVRYLGDPDSARVAAGWVYASDFETPRENHCPSIWRDERHPLRNRCLYVWRDGTWTLAAESSPGLYGEVLDEGRIVGWHGGGLGDVRGLPSDAFDGARSVSKAGEIEAYWHGDPIPTRGY